MEYENNWIGIMLEVKYTRPFTFCIKLRVYILVRFTYWTISQITLLQKLEFIMEMKEFCMNMDLMISSKYYMMVMTMVRMMISKTPTWKFALKKKRRPCWGTTYYLTFRYSNYLSERKCILPLSINILTYFILFMEKVPCSGRFWL